MVSCSKCERPICTSCMTQSPVGIRCPECAGGRRSAAGLTPQALRGGAIATMVLIAVNVVVSLAQLAEGIGVRGVAGSSIASDGGVIGRAVADGEWYRLLTAGFIHAGLLHLAFNMYALWWLGGALERYAGTGRMLTIYFASILWGSAGALLLSPDSLTVGASGGVFGLMAALLVLERQKGVSLLGGSVATVLLLNLVITFAFPGISIGGHLGGIAGGAVMALVLSGFGSGHLAYGRLKPPIVAAATALMVGAVVVGVLVA
jgi:membrane associated rhomboid family serine protease